MLTKYFFNIIFYAKKKLIIQLSVYTFKLQSFNPMLSDPLSWIIFWFRFSSKANNSSTLRYFLLTLR